MRNAAVQELLQSIVNVARAIFVAPAASIALLDEEADEFRFEAAVGPGDDIVGRRFQAGQGIAGAVVQSGEPVIIDDLSRDPRFAREFAKETGYVPRAMMVAPLLRGEHTLGVISVLDRGETGRSGLEELTLLAAFADQAAVAVELSEDAPAGGRALAPLAARLEALEPGRRAAAERLLGALEELLAR